MITPNTGERLIADEARRIYAEAELRTIEKLVKYINQGTDAEEYSQMWAQQKLSDLRKLKGEINEDVIAYLKNFDDEVMEAVDEAYKLGQKSAEADLRKVGQLEVSGQFTATNQRTVEALASDLVNKLDSTHLRILRQSEDVYREVIGEATQNLAAGVETRQEAAQSALNKFANRGVTGFTDSAGRSWSLPSYAEMATRTASGRAAIDGHLDRAKENGKDLVIVSEHGEECVLCRPWERQILSISGNSNEYPSMSEARAAGLFHANCRHSVSVYIPELTEDVGNKKKYQDPDGSEVRQTQRYNERQIRKWKKRKVAALTDKEEQKAQRYISKWQKKQRDFLDNTDRRRKYEREQINAVR